jgi:hypothetical protein
VLSTSHWFGVVWKLKFVSVIVLSSNSAKVPFKSSVLIASVEPPAVAVIVACPLVYWYRIGAAEADAAIPRSAATNAARHPLRSIVSLQGFRQNAIDAVAWYRYPRSIGKQFVEEIPRPYEVSSRRTYGVASGLAA